MNLDEAKNILKENGYILDEFFPFKGKKKEQEKSTEPEFLHYRNTSPYAGLIWKILEQINIDYNKSITKAQAINYIKQLLPAIKDNPKSEVYEKVLFDVINAIN
jgi:hypothetical protein